MNVSHVTLGNFIFHAQADYPVGYIHEGPDMKAVEPMVSEGGYDSLSLPVSLSLSLSPSLSFSPPL